MKRWIRESYKFKKKIVFAAISILLLAAPFDLSARDNNQTEAGLKTRIDNFLLSESKACFNRKSITGIKVISLKTGNSLYELNIEKLFTPASNMKLLTTAAALKVLNPDYRFKTVLFHDGRVKGDTVIGNLYIKGYGDPKLVSEELWLLVRDLKNIGINAVTGDIIADDSFFDANRYGPGWGKKLSSRAYNAKIGALSFNFNTVRVYVASGKNQGEKPYIFIDPPTSFVTLTNKAVTENNVVNPLMVYRTNGDKIDKIVVKGDIPTWRKPKYFYRNISDPPAYAVTVFKEFLEHEGITVGGKARIGLTPPDAPELIAHESLPLSLIIRDLNKMSNNFVAEQILKTLGAEIYGPPGTTSKGLKVLEGFLEEIGIRKGDYIVADGSGLSRRNRISPSQIITVLDYMYRDFTVSPEYISSLSIMGTDGSLEKRSSGNGINRKIRAKTGTLDGVSALSGYLTTENGEPLAFSIIMNRFKCPVDRAWDIQNKIVSFLAKE